MSDEGVSFASLEPPSDGGRFVSLRRLLGVESFGMNLIVLEPRQRGRVHRHDRQEEVYAVIEGELTLAFDGGHEHLLRRGDLVRVAPHVRRQLINAGREQLVLLALGGAGIHEGRDGAAWGSFEEGGEGHPPQEVPLPEDLPE